MLHLSGATLCSCQQYVYLPYLVPLLPNIFLLVYSILLFWKESNGIRYLV
jgi:hypothetical protein